MESTLSMNNTMALKAACPGQLGLTFWVNRRSLVCRVCSMILLLVGRGVGGRSRGRQGAASGECPNGRGRETRSSMDNKPRPDILVELSFVEECFMPSKPHPPRPSYDLIKLQQCVRGSTNFGAILRRYPRIRASCSGDTCRCDEVKCC